VAARAVVKDDVQRRWLTRQPPELYDGLRETLVANNLMDLIGIFQNFSTGRAGELRADRSPKRRRRQSCVMELFGFHLYSGPFGTTCI
jgi:hypothetical protein